MARSPGEQEAADTLVDRLRSGDHDAWRAVYDAQAGRLVAWLRALAPADTAASAEDLAAEAWLTAAQKIPEFRGSDDDFVGWLFGIARLHAANARRRDQRRQTVPTADAGSDVPARSGDADGLDGVRALLQTLPRRERQVLACLEVVQLDVAATAAALGMTRTAVRVARHRALARLRSRDAARREEASTSSARR